MEQTRNRKEINWDKLLSFAILAVLFFLSFSFGGTYYIFLYQAFGFMLAVALFLVVEISADKTSKKSLFYYAIPIIIFAIFSSFGRFWLSTDTDFIPSGFINMMGVVGYFLLGILSQRCKSFNFLYLLIAILGGLALLVLINTIITLVDYGPFYLWRYAAYDRYYDGIAYPIANEMGFLDGFSLSLASPHYVLSFAFVLASSLSALLFISPKEQKELFITIAVLGGIGLLSLLLSFSKAVLLVYVLLMVLALLLRFVHLPKKAPRWEAIVGWVLLGLVVLFLFVAFLNGLLGISALNKGFLGKLFNNSRMVMFNDILSVSFRPNGQWNFLGFFGMDSSYTGYWNNASVAVGFYAKNVTMEFTVLYEGGVLAFLAFLTSVVFAVISLRCYLHEGDKIDGTHVLVVFFLLAYLIYATLFSDDAPFTLQKGRYVSPVFQNALLTLCFFFLGLAYRPIFALPERRARLYEED
jgi:hypothetical protein